MFPLEGWEMQMWQRVKIISVVFSPLRVNQILGLFLGSIFCVKIDILCLNFAKVEFLDVLPLFARLY